MPSAALQPRSALFAICRFTRHVSIRAVKLVGGCKFGSEQTKRAEARRSDSTGSFEEAQVVMSSRPSLLVVLVLLFPEAPDAVSVTFQIVNGAILVCGQGIRRDLK